MIPATSYFYPGFHSLTPSLTLRGAAEAIIFYQKAFDASVTARLETPDGKVIHAELKIGNSHFMLGEETPEWGTSAPGEKGSPMSLQIYVPDANATFAQAVAAGATVVREVEDQFWGDRSGIVLDPFGYRWSLATHFEDVSPEEIGKRAAALFGGTFVGQKTV